MVNTVEVRFVIELAAIIMVAKVSGRVFQKLLRQPPVLGEMIAGMIIGPYALGGLSTGAWSLGLPLLGTLRVPGLGPLFLSGPDGMFNEGILHAITVTGVVTLLFSAGLETDLRRFVRFAPKGLAAGLGGAVGGFVAGAAAVALATGDPITSPRALAMGAVSTATSIGLTVRILRDIRRLNSPEGSTILSAAVIDDVLGLVALSIVFGVAGTSSSSGRGLSAGLVGLIALRGFGFFAALLFLSYSLRGLIVRLLGKAGSEPAQAVVALALGLLAAGVAEAAGLALVVGAYVMGLGLSGTRTAHRITEQLTVVRELLVPVFFCATGMMVDVRAFGSVLVLAVVFSLLAVVGKFLGCMIPARASGFDLRSSGIIGAGMLARQEVGLVAASMALVQGVISGADMGAVMMMILVTAVITPPLLVAIAGRGRPPGRRA
ncbi:cation:proton antiporter [Candidatus Fermentibacterales bacterium]|nr:cation:proton antiporter [Candidatus Fermentibacterales bacterium]